MHQRHHCLLLFLIGVLLMATACSSIDCVLSNSIKTSYGFYKSDGTPDTLKDTLYVIISKQAPEIKDTIINRDVNISNLRVHISYESPEDVYYIVRTFPYTYTQTIIDEYGSESEVTTQYTAMIADTVTISKENHKHFESIECNPAYFHTIKGINYTQNGIDSIVINHREVNQDVTKEHLHIYFKSHR